MLDGHVSLIMQNIVTIPRCFCHVIESQHSKHIFCKMIYKKFIWKKYNCILKICFTRTTSIYLELILLNSNSHVSGDIWKNVGRAKWPLFHMHTWPCDLQEIYHLHVHVCSEEWNLWQNGHMNVDIVLCVSLRFSPVFDLRVHTWILEGEKNVDKSLNGQSI